MRTPEAMLRIARCVLVGVSHSPAPCWLRLPASSAVHPPRGQLPLPTAVVAKDVLLQSDGRIVVSVQTPATDRFTVVRLRPDGSLDPSFGGGDGVAEIIIEPTRTAVVKDVALQPDGRIIASGHVMKDQTDSKFVLVRLRSDGSPDPTFSGDRKVTTDFVTRNGWNPSVALSKDGSIVAAGSDFTGAGILGGALSLGRDAGTDVRRRWHGGHRPPRALRGGLRRRR